MGYPQLSYLDSGVLVTLDFKRGPVDFICQTAIRAKDNLSTSGQRERVLEAQDLLITFSMPAIYVYDDYPAWSAFAEWAMDDVYFNLAPNSAFAGLLHCVSNDTNFTPSHKGVGWYDFSFNWQIVPDPLCPLNPGVVMQMFYGAGLIMAPAALPSATVGAAYSQALSLPGAAGTYAWSVVAGTLPAGLTLSTGGLLAGTPTAAGSSCFLVGAVLLGIDSLPVWTVLQISDLNQAAFRAYHLVVSA
jgi:hypothetical protein